MVGVGKAMSDEERHDLLDWETKNLDGFEIGTSDWPGWKRYLPAKPILSDADLAKDHCGYVYLLKVDSGEFKIGRTSNLAARIRNFKTLAPFEFRLIHSFPADDCLLAEKLLHTRFSIKKIKREWFLLDQYDVNAILELSAFKKGKFIIRLPQQAVQI